MDIVTPEQRSKKYGGYSIKRYETGSIFSQVAVCKRIQIQSKFKKIPCHPDIYLRKYNTVMFIHGCFWHRHKDCKFAYMPKSKVEFWQNKFEANQKRDFVVRNELLEKKIKCLVVWECSIKKMQKSEEIQIGILNKVSDFLTSEDYFMEL